MAKKDQIKGFEETINNIPLVIAPCDKCKKAVMKMRERLIKGKEK